MLDLLFSILCFNVLLVLFKFFTKYGVDNLQAIVINYVVAGSLGILEPGSKGIREMLEADWLPYAFFIGTFFILTFLLLAVSTQKVGMAISTVANKMSVVIVVIFAFALYGDQVTVLKIIGIVLALLGIFLTSTTSQSLNFDKKYLWMIIVIFLGQGLADIVFNYAQQKSVGQDEAGLFICGMFYAAGIVGLLITIFKIIAGKSKFNWKVISWGIALGIPNYFTVFFFFRALESSSMEATQVYPVYNIGVILLSSLIGFIIYREHLSVRNWIGIALSAAAIAAIKLG